MHLRNIFNKLCVKITLLIYDLKQFYEQCNELMYIIGAPTVTTEGYDGSHHPRYVECTYPYNNHVPRH